MFKDCFSDRFVRSILQMEDLEVDRGSHTVHRGIHKIDLSPKELALLEFLMPHEGRPVPQRLLLNKRGNSI